MDFREKEGGGDFRHGMRNGSRFCSVLPQLFYFSGPRGDLSGGFVCPSGAQREGLWKRPAEAACENRGGAGLRTAGVVVPGLEQTQH